MTLRDLASNETFSLCRRAAVSVAGRCRFLAQGTAADDAPLRGLLENLAGDLEKRMPKRALPSSVPQEEEDRLIRIYFPSLSKSMGAGFLDREAGTYLAECLLEEFAAFYRILAEQTPDLEARTYFLDATKAEEVHLKFVRRVLL